MIPWQEGKVNFECKKQNAECKILMQQKRFFFILHFTFCILHLENAPGIPGTLL